MRNALISVCIETTCEDPGKRKITSTLSILFLLNFYHNLLLLRTLVKLNKFISVVAEVDADFRSYIDLHSKCNIFVIIARTLSCYDFCKSLVR